MSRKEMGRNGGDRATLKTHTANEYNPSAQPRKRGKSPKTHAIIAAAAQFLEENHPATVRAVCYRLFVDGHIASMAKSNTNAVGVHLRNAREQGIIPWNHIVDETREAERAGTWDGPSQILNAAQASYRKDHWQSQNERLEVWSEKGTVRGTLSPVLARYGVTFRVMHGYRSATALYDIAKETRADPRPMAVLYVGDWDPSGLRMSEIDLPARLARYGGSVHFQRIALAAHDIADLPSFDVATKAGDTRAHWFRANFGRRCVELDAMTPNDLRAVVEDEIIRHIDRDRWEHSTRIEQAEIESMRDFLNSWPAINCRGGAV